MTTHSTPEPSAEALVAETKRKTFLAAVCPFNPQSRFFKPWVDDVEPLMRDFIDAEFAALRAKLKSANEVVRYYADCDALTSQQRERAFSFLNYS